MAVVLPQAGWCNPAKSAREINPALPSIVIDWLFPKSKHNSQNKCRFFEIIFSSNNKILRVAPRKLQNTDTRCAFIQRLLTEPAQIICTV